MSFIVKDTIRENKRDTGDRITGEIFSMSELLPEDATQEGGNKYGKDPLYPYRATLDPDTLYHHQAKKTDDMKAFLLAMIKEVTDKINNGNFSLIIREEMLEGLTLLPGVWQI